MNQRTVGSEIANQSFVKTERKARSRRNYRERKNRKIYYFHNKSENH